MTVFRRLTPFFTILSTLMISITLIAQDNCPAIVLDAFSQVDESCSDLGRETACYGYNNVQASFYDEVADDFFTLPGDLSVVSDLETIGTVPLNREENLWGIAVLQVQANLPNTLPGQNVVFILLGDAELTDDVPTNESLPDSEPIPAIVTANTNVRSGPTLRNNVITTLDNGTQVTVDGLSADENWARVSFDERAGWIFRSLLDSDLSDLPVVQGLNLAPMQAFHMTTGLGTPDCVNAPNAVLVQGTEDYEIEFIANGAEVRIGSTALLRLIDETTMQIMMLDGVGFVDDLRIPAGWKADIEIDIEGGTSQATDADMLPEALGSWLDCNRLDEDDLAIIDTLTNLPESILNYAITVPTRSTEPCQSPTIPVQTSDGSASQSQVAGVDCSSFQFLGPITSVTPRPQTFSWTDAVGADEYELVFFSVLNQVEAGNFRTPDTSLTVTLGEVPTGSEVQIEVRAYANGQYACVTPRTGIISLLADPVGGGQPIDPSSGVFSATWSCVTPSPTSADVTVSWVNAPSTATSITVDFIDLGSGVGYTQTASVPPSNNSVTFLGIPTTPGFPDYGNGTVTASPGGPTLNLSPANLDCN